MRSLCLKSIGFKGAHVCAGDRSPSRSGFERLNHTWDIRDWLLWGLSTGSRGPRESRASIGHLLLYGCHVVQYSTDQLFCWLPFLDRSERMLVIGFLSGLEIRLWMTMLATVVLKYGH